MAKLTLDAFASTKPCVVNSCKICALPAPLKVEVDMGLARGLPATVVMEWLKQEHNVVLSDTSVRRHKRTHLK